MPASVLHGKESPVFYSCFGTTGLLKRYALQGICCISSIRIIMLVGCIGVLMAVVDSILKVGEQEHSLSIE